MSTASSTYSPLYSTTMQPIFSSPFGSGYGTASAWGTASTVEAFKPQEWNAYFYLLENLIRSDKSQMIVKEAKESEPFRGGTEDDWKEVERLASFWIDAFNHSEYAKKFSIKGVRRVDVNTFKKEIDRYFDAATLVHDRTGVNDRDDALSRAFELVRRHIENEERMSRNTVYSEIEFEILKKGGFVAGVVNQVMADQDLTICFGLPHETAMDKLLGAAEKNAPQHFITWS